MIEIREAGWRIDVRETARTGPKTAWMYCGTVMCSGLSNLVKARYISCRACLV